MQIVLHLGAHCTDDDQLLRTLLQNKGRLAQNAISVPGPGRYRDTLVKAATKLDGEAASADTQEALLEEMIDDDSATRLILSHDGFLCPPSEVFSGGRFYAQAAQLPAALRALFPDHDIAFYLGICNPATLIPGLLAHEDQKHDTPKALLQGADPRQLRWSTVVGAIRDSNPGVPLVVWCNEDTPFLWPVLLRDLTGLEDDEELHGRYNIIGQIMQKEGMRRMRAYLASHPPETDSQRTKVMAAFLDKYAIPEAVETEIDLPGWDMALVRDLSQGYEDDLLELAAMDGITFLQP